MDLTKLSTEELERVLAERKKQDLQKKQMEKAVYEQDRDRRVESMVGRAKVLHNQMRDFKQFCYDQFEEFREVAQKYGDIRSNSKGGYSLRHSKTQEMAALERNTIPEYDERASMAEDLLKEFLQDQVKKKDLATYRTISALMERNRQGDFTISRIAALLKIKDNYSDKRWIKAMELFEESFRIREISYSVSFFTKDDIGKDKSIVLTFASIPVNLIPKEDDEPKNKS